MEQWHRESRADCGQDTTGGRRERVKGEFIMGTTQESSAENVRRNEMSNEDQLREVPDTDVYIPQPLLYDILGDDGVYDLCRRMTEIEKEMEAIHDKIKGLAEELNNSVKNL
jgi:hypothetical protein